MTKTTADAVWRNAAGTWPVDHDLFAVAADAFADAGDADGEAFCRWAVDVALAPDEDVALLEATRERGVRSYDWVDASRWRLADLTSTVSTPLFAALPMPWEHYDFNYREFSSPAEAWEALLAAWRTTGWRP